MKKYITKLLNNINKKTDYFEFKKILEQIKEEQIRKRKLAFVDIGSGLCDLVNFISENTKDIHINCLDINEDLVELAQLYGYESIQGKITDLPYTNDQFDITHCSHVIEHLGYPQVMEAIDELIRITKHGGIIIIRTPLWANHRFYNDIDHVRPYPPDAILNYFTNQQQQKVSKDTIVEVNRWYTKIYYEINPNRFNGQLTKYLNILLKLSWLYFSHPNDRYNNYGIILRKGNNQ